MSERRCQSCGCLIFEASSHDPYNVPWSDCGGDCTACLANAGDPDCIRAMKQWIGFLIDFHKVAAGKDSGE